MDGYRQLVLLQCFVLYLPAASPSLSSFHSAIAEGEREPFSVGSFLGGLRFLFSEPIVLAMVLLDFIVAGVGYYRPLLPIFAKDILYVGPAGFGVLSSAPAVGGIIGTVVLLVIGDVEHKGLLALWSFLSYAVAVGFFAISTNFWLSVFLLGILGLVNSLQAVMRQTTFHLLLLTTFAAELSRSSTCFPRAPTRLEPLKSASRPHYSELPALCSSAAPSVEYSHWGVGPRCRGCEIWHGPSRFAGP